MGRDKIILRGLRLFGRHGVLKAERELGQPFTVDVSIQTSVEKAGESDDVRDTLDYSRVFAICKQVVEQEGPYNLVEKVATRIITDVLTEFEMAEFAMVRVRKPHVAFAATLRDAGVQIERCRQDIPSLVDNNINKNIKS